ncbi:BgTH12-07391 [Blumeria graminis f. sp. triticale]|uniref:BgTH12-07391 n=1 Tax=Blumeria graminis f. sp. triticale TaxID=1689686 RepID=A0A9W4CWU2_BLUGR|nr:BgTH12-07391 [Blumeria graminis f. sp. triticale]
MHSVTFFSILLTGVVTTRADVARVVTDINKISRNWGHLSPYANNRDDDFGVEYVGLPAGCQIESAHTLQRHAERFPTKGINDGRNNQRFSEKVTNFTSTHPKDLFTGPLRFMNSWNPVILSNGLLTGIGASAEFNAGVEFWNRYGRTLYNASVGQLAYNGSYADGTPRQPIVLRTTEQSRMHNTQINWALGFFGPSFSPVPNPALNDTAKAFEVVIIPEENGGKQNNTLASYVSCSNCGNPTMKASTNQMLYEFVSSYLGPATERLKSFVPADFPLTVNDTFAMQMICAYENALMGASEFCGFFTEDEWTGFENSLEMQFYYKFSYGHPTGRAQGIGYVEELLARLNNTQMTSSSTSVNATLNSDPKTFPVNQTFYADFTHDTVITSVLSALSIDYFHAPPNLTQISSDPNRKFILSKIVPFGSRLVTETIGCTSPNPKPRKSAQVQYTPEQYGYEKSLAKYKFVRMRLNNGIIPLDTIRGGACGDDKSSRIDGLCALDDFMTSQQNASAMANYQYACYGNYTNQGRATGWDWDGTISE